ncbi:MAG: sulfatase-like hydrolase/transferase [Prolixibacteraceae bacterium]|jgi:arylsulfatase A-like enzyme|nr:sulfatase-like hydrolase/transferase [Prolixibacteraceae bacterium]MBT6005021.1 sulfatase-like hydrolase/transferase [Prolixibacteraceae bacterium]MBT6766504.1 sulfatase-like hydrolase/transferase [Prolixibacteraceae bacterium]MBT6997141.1 sulfatase-like hydrolase/transferase [Prolixibacteraceae bacterium]MBT7393326.1 sulfatase-like hydrolase/transferase [Prolixibacteraceae bacterium]
MKSKLILISIFALLFTACQIPPKEKKEGQKPSILLLLADDLGYGELGCYGQEIIQTPVLDNLAKQGMSFTDFYAGNAVCSPSRAVLLTGKSSSFNTIRGNNGHFDDDSWMRVALKKDEITMAEMLREEGYQTGFVGKWHLDNPNDVSTWAYNRGFDFAVQEQWGSRFGGIQYDAEMHWIDGKQDSVYYHMNEWQCKDEFRTELAFNFLDKLDKNKPFFLFMSYRAPHGHEREIGNQEIYSEQNWQAKERLHAAKITLLDEQIGRMLQKLEEMDELKNTLVLFTSDNGPHHEGHNHEYFNSNGALKGFKRDLYEGGIRVPLIAFWEGKIKSEEISNHVAGFQDLMPTLADVVGIEVPEQSNGISILPVLTGKQQPTHNNFNWEFQLDGWGRKMPTGGFRQSARIDNWKGVRYGINSETELYNLEVDISEANNIAADHPEIVKKMIAVFEEERTETPGFPYGGVVQKYPAKEKHISN